MNDDDINKVETLLGYLESYVKHDPSPPHYLPGVIAEAQEWIDAARATLSPQTDTRTADGNDVKQ